MTEPRKSPANIYSLTLEESLIPWRSLASWTTANQTVAHLINLYEKQMEPATKTASRILSGFAGLQPLFDELCRLTCVSCTEPCCRTADVRYDLRDLLFMHLTGQNIPDGQPRRKTGETCRYLNGNGCSLTRYTRPWICTWYVCPEMKKLMTFDGKFEGHRLIDTIQDMGDLRKRMEDVFIRVVAG